MSAWCWRWTLSLFSPAPHSPLSSSALQCLHCSREQWRHGSAEEEEKTRASSYWKKKKKRAPLVTGRKFSCAPLVTVL